MSGPNPSGLCMCGCGERTSIAKANQARFGHVKGQPVSFRPGHCTRKSPVDYLEEDRGYKTPCWIWQKAVGRLGYGNTWADGTTRNAHRVYYERARGEIPAGMQLDHLCRNRACVNPDHLEPVTNAENCRRGNKTHLTFELVAQIKAATGSSREIAERLGLRAATVANIRAGRRWAT